MRLVRARNFGLFGCLFLSACNPFGSSWADDCEDAFKYRLISPSSYERVSVDLSSEPLTIDDYLSENPRLMEAQIQNLREQKPDIRRWTVTVTYDAANSFNAKLRGSFYCQAVTKTGQPPPGGADEDYKRSLMKVSGVSTADIQANAAKEYLKARP